MDRLIRAQFPSQKILFIFTILILLIFPVFSATTLNRRGHDEFVVSEISRQPLPAMLESVKYDPHPPLFYFLIGKMDSIEVWKQRVVVYYLATLILCLAFLISRKTIEKNNLYLFCFLTIFSQVSLSIMTSLKQDSLSVPLLFLCSSIALSIRGKDRKSNIIMLCLLTVQMLVGYINYFWTLLFLLILEFYKKDRTYALSIIVSLVIFGAYFLLFGYEQLINNLTRFSWLEMYPNSIVEAVQRQISGIAINSPQTDIITVLTITLSLVGIWGIKRKPLLIAGVCVVILTGYLLSLFKQDRYSYAIFVVIIFLIQTGLNTLKEYFRSNVVFLANLLVISLGIYGISGYVGINIANNHFLSSLTKEITNLPEVEDGHQVIGIISNYETFPTSYINEHLSRRMGTSKVLSINTQSNFTDYTQKISPGWLALSKKNILTKEEIVNNIKSYRANTILFVEAYQTKNSQRNTSVNTISALKKVCTFSEVVSINPVSNLYVFTTCSY